MFIKLLLANGEQRIAALYGLAFLSLHGGDLAIAWSHDRVAHLHSFEYEDFVACCYCITNMFVDADDFTRHWSFYGFACTCRSCCRSRSWSRSWSRSCCRSWSCCYWSWSCCRSRSCCCSAAVFNYYIVILAVNCYSKFSHCLSS
jgi:hypothetical protein